MAAISHVFKRIFLNGNIWISINISSKFVPRGPIDNIPALVQIMAWRRPGDKPLSEPMLVSLLTHICVSKFRCSSHILEIERGRYINPQTPIAERLCYVCHEIENEKHFLIHCSINAREREDFFAKVNRNDDDFYIFRRRRKIYSYIKKIQIKTVLHGLTNSSIGHFSNEMNLPFPGRVHLWYHMYSISVQILKINVEHGISRVLHSFFKICILFIRQFFVVFGHVFYFMCGIFYCYLVIAFYCLAYFIHVLLSFGMYSSGVDEIKNVNLNIPI